MFSRKSGRRPVTGRRTGPENQPAKSPKTTSGAPGVSADGSDGGYNAGIAVFSYIVGGIIVWSLIGWGLDNLWGTRWIVLAGALLGAAGGFYLSHMHGLTSNRTSADDGTAARGPSQDEEQ
jgi:F0F1-type ATP synthase assembly protein I